MDEVGFAGILIELPCNSIAISAVGSNNARDPAMFSSNGARILHSISRCCTCEMLLAAGRAI
jgi:hypothetical protein